MRLAFDTYAAPGASPTKTMVWLHGMLGTGNNLRTIARRVVDARPDWQAALVDLRAHGESLGTDGEDTVHGAAQDVVDTFAVHAPPVRAVVGHSFGGKVALALWDSPLRLAHVCTLDSGPGARLDARGSEATLKVLDALEATPGPFPSRDAFVQALGARGLEPTLGRWLAMQLHGPAGALRFAPSLPRLRALLRSYFEWNAWPVFHGAVGKAGAPHFHLVIGAASRVYGEADLATVQGLVASSAGQVTSGTVQAGHWVHVEAPDAVVAEVLRWA